MLLRVILFTAIAMLSLATLNTNANAQITNISVVPGTDPDTMAEWTFTFTKPIAVAADQDDELQTKFITDGIDDGSTTFSAVTGVGAPDSSSQGFVYYTRAKVTSTTPAGFDSGPITVLVVERAGFNFRAAGVFSTGTVADVTYSGTPVVYPVTPLTIESVVHPSTAVDPLTYGAARWVVKFSEPVRIDINSSGADVADAVDAAGNISGASIFGPRTTASVGGNAAANATERAFAIQRCSNTPTASCAVTGANADGQTILGTGSYRVYTTDRRVIGSNVYGTTFVYQVLGLSNNGFASTHRLQLIVTANFGSTTTAGVTTGGILNQAGDRLIISGLDSAGSLSRSGIQTATNVGGTNTQVRSATIIPMPTSNLEYVPPTTQGDPHLLRANVYFSHQVSDVIPADFSFSSPNSKFGAGTVEQELSSTNFIYTFTVPITENDNGTTNQTINMNWTPSTSDHQSTVPNANNQAFSFVTATDPTNTVATITTTIPAVTDTFAPTIDSIDPNTSATTAANDREVTWVITFSEPVSGLTAANIEFTGTLGASTIKGAFAAQSPVACGSNMCAREWQLVTTTPITGTGLGTITATLGSGAVSDAAGNTLTIDASTADNSETLDWSAFTSVITRLQRIDVSSGAVTHGGNSDRDGNPSTDASTMSSLGTLGNPFKSDAVGASFGFDIGYASSSATRPTDGISSSGGEQVVLNTSYSLRGQLLISCVLLPTTPPASNECTSNFTTDMRHRSLTSNNGTSSHRLNTTAAIAAVPEGRIAKFTMTTLYPNGVPFSNIDTSIPGQESNEFYFANVSNSATVAVPPPPSVTVATSQTLDSGIITGDLTITYTATYANPPTADQSLVEGFIYRENATNNRPSNAVSSVNPSTYGIDFDCGISDCSAIQLGTTSVTRNGNVDTIVINLSAIRNNHILDVALTTGERAISAPITSDDATVQINPLPPITPVFDNENIVVTSYSIEFPITIDPPVGLNATSNPTSASFFTITSSGGSTTALTDIEILDSTLSSSDDIYIVRGVFPHAPGDTTTATYTATFTPPANTLTDATSGRTLSTQTISSAPQTINFATIPEPEIVSITLDRTGTLFTNVAGSPEGKINLTATFNHPVAGVNFPHFATVSQTGISAGTTITTVAGIDASKVTVNSIDYFTQYKLTTENIVRNGIPSTSSLVIRANIIDSVLTDNPITPIGGATTANLIRSDGNSNPVIQNVGGFDADATPPTISTVQRTDADDDTGGADAITTGGEVRWRVTFDQDVTGVDMADFMVTITPPTGAPTNMPVAQVIPHASNAARYVVRVVLPTDDFDTDSTVALNLFSSVSATLDIKDTSTEANLFVPIDTTVALQNPPTVTTDISRIATGDFRQYTLNNDNDPIVLTVSRTNNAPRSQTSRVDGDTHEVSWTLEFDKPVEGVDVTGPSSQFAIRIGGATVGVSVDSASTDVFVTGSGNTYTATVALPQSSYPADNAFADTALNFVTGEVSPDPLSDISQVQNSHNKSIFLSTDTDDPRTNLVTAPGALLTNDTNNYTVNTGALTVDSITSVTGTTPRTAVFTITFNTRVKGLTNTNFTLLQDDGTTALTGTPAPTITNSTVAIAGGSASRFGTETGMFSYTWTVTTIAIADGEAPRLTIANITNIDPEGNANAVGIPTGDDLFHNHEFIDDVAPEVTTVVRFSSNSEITSGGTVEWRVGFNEDIGEFDTGGTDFVVTIGTGSNATTLPSTDVNVSYLTSAVGGSIFTLPRSLIVEATLPITGVDTDTPVTLSFASTTTITDQSTNNPANPAVVPATNPPTYEGNSFVVPRDGVIAGAQQFTLNTNTIDVQYGTPTNDGYSISVPITFTPPIRVVNLNTFSSVFSIRNSAGTDLGITGRVVAGETYPTIVADPEAATNGTYTITALLLGTAGQGVSDTHTVSFTAPSGGATVFGNADPNLGARVVLATPLTTTHIVDFPNIPAATLTDIKFDQTSIPAIGASAKAVNFIAEFNYPVTGVTADHFAITGSTYTTNPPTVGTPVGRGTAVNSNGVSYYTEWTIPTSPVTRATGSDHTITMRADINDTELSNINPIGLLSAVLESDDSHTAGVAISANNPVIMRQATFEVATAPFVSGVVLGSAASQKSGDITWTITFDQAVTNVSADHFNIVVAPTNTAISNITPTISPSDGSASNTFTLTLAGIPATGIDAPTTVSLALDDSAGVATASDPSTTAILGAMGPDPLDTSQMTNLRLLRSGPHDLSATHSGSAAEYSILNDARFVSLAGSGSVQSAGTQEFTLTFSREVEGLDANTHFSVTDSRSTPNTTITGFTPALTTASSSYVVNTMTTGTTTGTMVTLSLENLTSVMATNTDNTVVTAISAAETATQGFLASAPEVPNVTLGSGQNQSSGDITWEIEFNQAVTRVSADHFNIVSDSSAIRNITPTISPSDGSASSTFTLTLSGIPATGIDAPTEVSLALDSSAGVATAGQTSNTAILGAMGPNPSPSPAPAMISLPLVLPSDLALEGFIAGVPPRPREYSILNDARITSFIGTDTNQTSGIQEFTITFSRDVMGLTQGVFSATDTLATPTTSVTGFTATNPTTYVITTETTGTKIGTTVTLSLANLNAVTATNTDNPTVTPLSNPPRTAEQGFIATPPLLTTATIVSGSTGISGDIGWTITFNQAVTGISPRNFEVAAVPSSSLITGRPLSIVGSGNTYTLTLSGIPESGIDTSTEVFLRLSSSANLIMGSPGPRSITDNEVITRPLELSNASHNTALATAKHMILNDARVVSLDRSGVDRDNALQFFTLTFSRPVTGLTPNDFSVVIGDSNPAGLTSMVTDVSITVGDPNSLTITTSTPSTLSQREDRFAILTLSSLSNASVSSGSVIQLSSSLTARQSLLGRLVNGITVPPDATVVEVTQELTESFVERRAAQILTSSPALSTRLVRTTTSTSNILDTSNQNFSAEVTDSGSSMDYTGNFTSFIPELSLLSFFPGAGEFWTNVSVAVSSVDTGASGTSFFSTTGIDYVTSTGVVWGALIQLDMSDEDGAATQVSGQSVSSELSSFGWLSGPYFAYDSGGFAISGRAALGASTTDISPYGTGVSTNEYETDRLLLSAGASGADWGEFLQVGGWSYSPTMNYTYYREDVDAYDLTFPVSSNIADIAISGVEYELSRFEFGHSFSHSYVYGVDSVLTPSVGISGIYDKSSMESTGVLSPSTVPSPIFNDIKARLDASIIYSGSSGINWNAATYYEGIGSDNNTYGLSIGLGIKY